MHRGGLSCIEGGSKRSLSQSVHHSPANHRDRDLEGDVVAQFSSDEPMPWRRPLYCLVRILKEKEPITIGWSIPKLLLYS